ncbi:leucyl/phenylalanyl-tRNA--protein transferase [Labrys sp. LIt4]|uniref:Leucyl/phenylalanyl-tRNA--protein transferase n=1 Tax=Labrys okinawensis TaxID=346911 RepID=A0A2S9Q6Y3_9HYPH|nr:MULTISPECIES: leucyl/phenylalanyl-tRNA--protein transferase [Labrys]MBP0579014.1 leucyl/phenylalanyl-tRNA--protein transferase [Labrys sp. LIt4]PRH85111.1 leucyl/phenylalanyl-tRNA--protein transferase [Labrys okinawensis]
MSGAELNLEITPQVLLKAYACGIFPMAESADDPGLYWVEPEFRGIIPLDGVIVSHRLARTIRSDRFEIVVDRDFDAVIDGCAQAGPGRRTTWINASIRRLYGELFRLGHCHTVEAYRNGRLVGGLYGVDLGGAFFGESMFHRESDASKVALVHLVARLRRGGYQLLDTQFVTDHLTSLGAIELPRSLYHRLLDDAVAADGDFLAWPKEESRSGTEILAALAD